MSTFDHNRLALVVASSRDGGSSGLPAENVGTGYFITKDLILTTRHVAEGPDCTFSVRVEVGEDEQGRWAEADPQWIGIGDVDAMLLRTRRQFGDWTAPPLRACDDRGTWESAGYARIAADEEQDNRKTLPLYGSFGLSFGQGSQELALVTEQNIAPNWESYWKGISGAPVFSNESGNDGLIGIITDANRTLANGLVGLPTDRLLNDIRFRSIIAPSFLGQLPTASWCLVLTPEGSPSDLVEQVTEVLTGFRENFPGLRENPVVVPVLEAVRSVENWAATVDALARADYMIADVTSFQPAVMLLLGIRSVLRRGVTVSVTAGELAAHSSTVPFNVQETRVLSFNDRNFYDDLYRAMAEGAANLARDANYLDLPAYHAVRAPRPEAWAEDDAKSLLVLCPFSQDYSGLYWKLHRTIRAYTHNVTPLRMLDLRSPRLVGQALYEQIRWSSRCVVDWTSWRPNVFFEFGVRLACCEHDPLCIIQERDLSEHWKHTELSTSRLAQRDLLQQLFDPVAYDPDQPRETLKNPLEFWSSPRTSGSRRLPSERVLPSAATFEVAQASFQWQRDSMLTPPHVEQRAGAERILGKDQERRPERLVLFADNDQFDAELRAAVRERWIATWLYLKHLSSADDTCPQDIHSELITVGRLVQHALSSSSNPRHVRLRKDIREFLRADRAQRRIQGIGGDSV
jgi:hypothetical protein